MKKQPCNPVALVGAILLFLLSNGCRTAGSAASDIGFASAGGLAGYEISHKKIGGAALGTAAGYLASRAVQFNQQNTQAEAEQRGYDRAMNQAVKQQYWIIQNQQRSLETKPDTEGKLVPVIIPETKINGVVQAAHVEYLRL